ncbi:MAG: TraM recognition domain-containing protein [Myxococcaceae bacterium]
MNAYEPDIVFERVLQQNEIVYVQLPANLFKIQAPAMGKVMLMDVQQEGSLRQVFRRERNQTPFAVTVDEFYNFADESIIDSLNKLRDANLEYTLAHQSIADLELVSKEFATAVWDNTRTKDILNQDNPELCEKLAKSIGTRQIVEKTVRQQQGALFTSLTTGDASTKLVEAYNLHPNAIKSLARCGQGFLFNDEGLQAVSYGMLPAALSTDYPLPRNRPRSTAGLRLYETFIERRQPDASLEQPSS